MRGPGDADQGSSLGVHAVEDDETEAARAGELFRGAERGDRSVGPDEERPLAPSGAGHGVGGVDPHGALATRHGPEAGGPE